jgi:hypothetical protein
LVKVGKRLKYALMAFQALVELSGAAWKEDTDFVTLIFGLEGFFDIQGSLLPHMVVPQILQLLAGYAIAAARLRR